MSVVREKRAIVHGWTGVAKDMDVRERRKGDARNWLSGLKLAEAAGAMIAFLALGSNLGDRAGFLDEARNRIRGAGISILMDSGNMETKPVLLADQPDFLNAVLKIETSLSAMELLDFAKRTESILGRQATVRYGPREIDIDILAYEQEVRNDSKLTLPHPGLRDREYLHILLARMGLSTSDVTDHPVR
ncbi:MAG: 2-amino-4-hydroxy-6-hydroxymethyldihydropteridine diphosphokinase [Leptospirales bacterium]|nr:2-amino-4-hydroxy-6-hydroxymethyldihydropteridine diphosphokinase [Leptospirales bacterium]